MVIRPEQRDRNPGQLGVTGGLHRPAAVPDLPDRVQACEMDVRKIARDFESQQTQPFAAVSVIVIVSAGRQTQQRTELRSTRSGRNAWRGPPAPPIRNDEFQDCVT